MKKNDSLNGFQENQPLKTEYGIKPSYYVGIGASAGGLEALQLFFENMQSENGLAFIVVQHLSPDYKSLMVELLSKYTKMEVLRVEDGVSLEPDKVYLIPPRKNMVIQGGNLYLSEQPERHRLNLPIDLFFRSLAEDQGERAIGVILSGTGSDGTRGIRAIKEEGGIVIVQDEESAKFDGMPRSAIATGLADFILRPENMPEELLRFINHPCIAEKKEPADIIVKEEDNFSKIFSILNKKANVDFSYYKPSTMVRRIERRMGITQVHSLDEYLVYLHRNPKEVTSLFKDMLIGVTKFFRDQESFLILRHKVIPLIFKNAEKREYKSVRVWTPGCSTGEEAYSIAMLLQDYMDTTRNYMDVKVFATDIDREAIEFAGIGLYPESIVAELNMEFISRYFEKRAKGYQVRRSIREMVVFAIQNLIKDPPFTKVDLISCRNLLIYLQPVLQKKVFSTFNYALVAGGYLFLGTSESVGDAADNFEAFDLKNRIYSHPNKGTVPIKGNIVSSPQVPALSSAYKLYSQPRETEYTQRYESQETYYHALIRSLASSVFVINEERELIQSFGEARNYLKVPEGNMSLDILMMLPRDLSLAASSAIHKVRKNGDPVVYNDIRIKENGNIRSIDLKVGVIPDTKGHSRIFIMKIEESRSENYDMPNNAPALSSVSEDFMVQRINDLEQEVQFTRENLQATIEELQTSNEELQATNEELLAANEELQSTNEELQSVNEELNTVNTEYQAKNTELTELNYDMKNLMESTNIGTIFLDKNLCIRKFTPAINRIVNLLVQDIGRPIRDLYIPLFGDDILKNAEDVLKSSESIEKRISSGKETFIIRILPFIDDKKVSEGIVITIVDISTQASIEKELNSKNELLEMILEQSPSAQLVVDKNGIILFANLQAEAFLNFKKKNLLNMNLYSPELNLKDLDGIPLNENNSPVTSIINSGSSVKNFVICQHRKNEEEMIFSVSGNPVSSGQDNIQMLILKLEILAHKGCKQKGDKENIK